MATAQNICDRAYQKIGLSDPTTIESTLAFNALNDMISAWGTRFLVPYNIRESFDLVVGTAEYTVGSGGNFDTVRPMLINNAYLVDSDDRSYPIQVIAGKDYNRIGSKTNEGRPTKVYYYNEYSLVKLFFNKETDVVYTVHFDFTKNFTEFATISSTVELPNEYKEALVYNLTIKLAEDNSIDLAASVNRTAANGLMLIERLLAANKMPPKVTFDFRGGELYNIENDC
jgi:hypothetical protein